MKEDCMYKVSLFYDARCLNVLSHILALNKECILCIQRC